MFTRTKRLLRKFRLKPTIVYKIGPIYFAYRLNGSDIPWRKPKNALMNSIEISVFWHNKETRGMIAAMKKKADEFEDQIERENQDLKLHGLYKPFDLVLGHSVPAEIQDSCVSEANHI